MKDSTINLKNSNLTYIGQKQSKAKDPNLAEINI